MDFFFLVGEGEGKEFYFRSLYSSLAGRSRIRHPSDGPLLIRLYGRETGYGP